jgi:hypothetical protein
VVKKKVTKAERKWNQYPEEIREKLLANVFCHKCNMTTIKDYICKDNSQGILLMGKCAKCDGDVMRLVEDLF